MKKKGFTLVELLAVIVLIAIVLVIVVPKIGNVYYSSRKNTFKTNAKTIIKSSQDLYQSEFAGSLSENNVVYEIENGKILRDGEEVDIIDGKIDGTGFVQITSDGDSKIAIENNEFCVVKEFEEGDIVIKDKVDGELCGVVNVPFSYELNGGQTTQQFASSYIERTKITLVDPTKADSHFVEWKIVKGNSFIKDNVLTIGSTETILYALWKNNPVLTVDLNGGQTTQQFASSYESNSVIILENPTRIGHTFTGWEILLGNAILSGNRFTIGAQDTTIRANWKANTYQISYELNGGTKGANAPTSGTYGTTVTVSIPTKVGYTFTGWTLTGEGSSINGTSLNIGHQDIKLTANWQINTYQISYELNGGTKGTNAPTSGVYGTTVTVDNPTKVGHTFKGWSVQGTGAVLNGTSLTIGSSDIKLIANWEANTYTVTTYYYYLYQNTTWQHFDTRTIV